MFLHPIQSTLAEALNAIYGINQDAQSIDLITTKKEFEGDYTLVVFPFVKLGKKAPDVIATELGEYMVAHSHDVVKYNVIKGFLNLTLSDGFWISALSTISNSSNYGTFETNGKKVMVEFSSPNTNKPLHLGHIRNILLGWSCSRILEANGYKVIKTQIINDRGIAICKSMLAWQLFGEGQTPSNTNIKSDHFVGDFYVLFEQKFQKEYLTWQSSDQARQIYSTRADIDQSEESFFKGYKNTYFNEFSNLGAQAKAMLIKWEEGDTDTKTLWAQMNEWVYEGFSATYDKLKVSFDKLYYESDTYLLGKDAVNEGLKRGVFYQQDDSSIWVDLSDVGMDQKIVQRKDGTAVYMTQDLGTAMMRYKDFGVDSMIYTVADEQDYHFKVLFEILKRLGEPYANQLHHLSYGMVDLPSGRMKSREGTVVDADDLIAEVVAEANANVSERGELVELSNDAQQDIINKIALAAIKYFIIKVQPQKRMIFDPKESVDMQGQTGPYIQNAYVRIKSIQRKNNTVDEKPNAKYEVLEPQEKVLLSLLMSYPDCVKDAGAKYDPSSIANFSYALAKEFHKFYHDVRILGAETPQAKAFRLDLCGSVANVLAKSMELLGIEMPEKM